MFRLFMILSLGVPIAMSMIWKLAASLLQWTMMPYVPLLVNVLDLIGTLFAIGYGVYRCFA